MRIVILHLAILGGVVPLMFVPRLFAVLLVAGKTALDLWTHRRERRWYAEKSLSAGP